MTKISTKEKYNELFWDFWKKEIPNIIQILTLPTFFGVLIKNNFVLFFIFVFTVYLISTYTVTKMVELIKNSDESQNLVEYGFSKKNFFVISILLSFVAAFAVCLIRWNI